MTQFPRLEARVGAQEQMSTMLHARLVELAEDMTASFKQQVDYQVKFEHMIEARFDKVEGKVATIEANMATKEDLASLESRMEARVAALETRMLDAFKQLLAVIDSRLPPSPRQE